MSNRRVLFSAVASALAVGLMASSASALTVAATGTTSDGDDRPISATADINATATDELTVQLTNATLGTISAGQLLTGVDIELSGVSGVTLTSASGIGREIDGSGAFVDTGTVNLLAVGPAGQTWSVVDQGGGVFRLNFNPDAMYGIVGAPTGGDYSEANGSIAGNAGHNPYLAETGTFVITAPGLDESDVVSVTFLFGTDFGSELVGGNPPGGGEEPGGEEPGGGENPVIPEPASVGLLAMGLAGLMLRVRRIQR